MKEGAFWFSIVLVGLSCACVGVTSCHDVVMAVFP